MGAELEIVDEVARNTIYTRGGGRHVHSGEHEASGEPMGRPVIQRLAKRHWVLVTKLHEGPAIVYLFAHHGRLG